MLYRRKPQLTTVIIFMIIAIVVVANIHSETSTLAERIRSSVHQNMFTHTRGHKAGQ